MFKKIARTAPAFVLGIRDGFTVPFTTGNPDTVAHLQDEYVDHHALNEVFHLGINIGQFLRTAARRTA